MSDDIAAQLIGVGRAYDGAVDLSCLVAIEPGRFDVEDFIRHWGERRVAAVCRLATALEPLTATPEVADARAAICAASQQFEAALRAMGRYRDLTPRATLTTVDEMAQAYCELQGAVERATRALHLDLAELDRRLWIRGHLLSFLHVLPRSLEHARGERGPAASETDAVADQARTS